LTIVSFDSLTQKTYVKKPFVTLDKYKASYSYS